ncbi:MAG: hypothetical protein KFW09_04905 [Oscillospiraceae bacterium]|nr:hypothetical protein [Oscillospiraceae bacterium]
MKNILTNLKKLDDKIIIVLGVVLSTLFLIPQKVFANPILSSKVIQGLSKMLNDASFALLFIAPIAGAVMIGFFALMKMVSSDNHDGEKYVKRIKQVAIAVVIVFSASTLITIISSYFK